MTTTLSRTDEVLIRMLTENTGRSILDSGDIYGRHWQQNQGRDFVSEPHSRAEFRVYRYGGRPEPEIMVTHSVFHWLSERLDYDADLQALYDKWVEENSDAGQSHLADMEEFVDWLSETDDEDADHFRPSQTGIWGDRKHPYTTINTYNGEDLLSQILQYIIWDTEYQEQYILLQIHGGCDARGGYTAPRAFRLTEDYAMYQNAEASLGCTEGHNWDTDDANHWYYQGSTAGTELQEYDAQEIDLNGEVNFWGEGWLYPTLTYEDVVEVYEFMGWDHSDILPIEPVVGKLSVDQDHRGYCPRCGEQLRPYF